MIFKMTPDFRVDHFIQVSNSIKFGKKLTHFAIHIYEGRQKSLYTLEY